MALLMRQLEIVVAVVAGHCQRVHMLDFPSVKAGVDLSGTDMADTLVQSEKSGTLFRGE
jgi:hypothetical protein